MPTLTINNETNITNVNGVSLTAIPVVNPRINVVTVGGPKGDKGDPGINATGGGGFSAGVTGINGLTGAVNVVGAGSISVSQSGNSIIVSGNNGGAGGFGNVVTGTLTITGLETSGSVLNMIGGPNGGEYSSISMGGSFPSFSIYVDDTTAVLETPAPTMRLNAAGQSSIKLEQSLVTLGAVGAGYPVDLFIPSGIVIASNITETGTILLGNIDSLSGSLVSSGRRAWDDAINLSGRVAATGAAALAAINSVGTTLSGQLALTGQGAINYTDVRVAVTGQANINYTDSRVAATGQQAWTTAQNNALNLSGVISATGRSSWDNAVNLSGNLFSTGNLAILNANGIGANLSGNLLLTGQKTWLFETALSGNVITTGQTLLTAIASTGQNAVNYTDTRVAATGLANVNYTDSRVAASGQSAWIASQNNALNLSGSINNSGRAAWDNAINLSGRLMATGALLSAVQVTGSSIIQNVNLTGLGGTLVIQSGGYVLISGAGGGSSAANNGDGINLSGRLTATGAILISNDINLSGSINASGRRAWDDATNLSGNLSATGNTLWQRDLSISGALAAQIAANAAGVSTVNGASGALFIAGTGSIISVFNTGQYIYISGNNNDGLNLSGNLLTTGSTLIARDLATSGELSNRLTLTGQTAQNNAFNLSGNLNASGRRAWDDATNLSGAIFSTGNLAILNANGVGTNLSGNLLLTGQKTWLFEVALSGNLTTSGQNLLSVIASTGQNAVNYTDARAVATGLANVNYTDARVAATGQAAWISANGAAQTLSGNMTLTGQSNWLYTSGVSGNVVLTGQALLTAIANSGQNAINYTDTRVAATGLASVNYTDSRVAATGQQAWTASQNNALNLSGVVNSSGRRAWDDATNLSGNLFSTGNLAILNANGIGFNLSGRLVATGALLSALTVTGSSIIQIANLTGLGGTIVFISGGYVVVSGTTPSLAGVDHGDGINLSGALNASGRRAWDDATNLSGNLFLTGQNANSYTDSRVSASGAAASSSANSIGINLSGNLFSTGNLAILHANGIGANVSGRLTASGALLSAVVVTGSSLIQNVNLTGMGGTMVWLSGGYVIVSGASASLGGVDHGDGINLSGNLNASGRRAWDDATNLSGNLFSTGNLAILHANGIGTNLSGNLLLTGQKNWLFGTTLSGNLTTTGQTLLTAIANTGQNAVNYTDTRVAATGLANVSYTDTRVAATGQAAWVSANGAALGLSGNLTLTGQTAQNNALNLSGSLNSSGRRAWDDATNLSGNLFSTGNLAVLHANGIGINLSGRLVATGALLSAITVTGSAIVQVANFTGLGGALVFLSGGYVVVSGGAGSAQAVVDHGDGINLSGRFDSLSGALSITGSVLWDRDLAISGGLEARMAGGGTVVSTTGSTAMSFADFTGIGTTIVLRSGDKIVISGAQGGAGGGVSSINGLSNAVNIFGSGGLKAVTAGQNIYISGDQSYMGNENILFMKDGFITGEPHLLWNVQNNALEIGDIVNLLPNNPLAIAGSGDAYIQVNIQNLATGANASSDLVLTANNGTDTSNFIDLGINNQGFNDPVNYQLYKPLDGYLYISSGDLNIGTSTRNNVVKIHVGGITSGNLVATFDESGLKLSSGDNIRFAEKMSVQPRELARKQYLSVIQSGLDSMALQPALWNRTFTAAFPATTTSQTLFGNTAANVGTLSTVRDQVLGKHTNVVTAAGQGAAAGLGFTTPDFLRGTITGAGNGFFFTCRFALSDGINPTGAYAQPSGSRIFVGMTDQTSTVITQTNNPAGNRAGLSFLFASGGAAANVFNTDWRWTVKDNTTETTGSLGWAFQTGAYRFSMYCPPFQAGRDASGIWFQLDDLIRGSGVTGIMTGQLPIGTTALGPVASITTISGGARNIKINSIYCEEARGGGNL